MIRIVMRRQQINNMESWIIVREQIQTIKGKIKTKKSI